MKTEEFTEEFLELEGIKIRRLVYKIGESYYCHVHNDDPGAVIARASNADKQNAIEEAMRKAGERILKTSGRT